MTRPEGRGIARILLLALLGIPTPGASQERIEDNSFLIEEGYNQERGVVQHINTFSRSTHGQWSYAFTQEWPFFGQRHQLSYTIPVERMEHGSTSSTGLGDIAINYRYQLIGMKGGRAAMSPRLTLLLPTGEEASGHGAGALGLNAALPVSILLSPRFVTHYNAGVTIVPQARNALGDRATTTALGLGASLIFLATPTLNLMLEAVWASSDEVLSSGRTGRSEESFLSPGVRYAVNTRSGLQIVPGIAYTIGIGPSADDNSVFLYLSFEHRFARE
jgi:hypothetical protein